MTKALRLLLTGSTGVVGSAVAAALRREPDIDMTCVARIQRDPSVVSWDMASTPAPAQLAGPWDVIVHTAASTRWTMDRDEATLANIAPLRAVLALANESTHIVHLSTAFVTGGARDASATEFDGYRNGYEWSKAISEDLLLELHSGPTTIVRPPLIIGSQLDGTISRFSGPYTLVQTLVSGLAAAVVGDPQGFAEFAPVDQVADVTVRAARTEPAAKPVIEVIAAGPNALRLGEMLDIMCLTVNEWRKARGFPEIEKPPIVSSDLWHRFLYPLAREHLSPVQLEVVRLLSMFESYTSLSDPFEPTVVVENPGEIVRKSVLRWADDRPRMASRAPQPWRLID